MKKLSKVKLTNLSQEDLADREMNALRGGHTCGCACIKGAEFKATNYSANVADDKYSPEGNIICNWVGGSGSDMAVYGGSKVPGMP
ncbi:TIGR04149 family rSAM-modified RiPP [Bacteroides fragilis]|uniref:TIGR04149 family rSAM-modified RiPP n=1 Tax=Bacteroides fragilis TaxID=817 RepID=UPI0022E9428A|nr:TIGR04149 family rSAM-modified RiPP [Bacteroides fragilis]